jgi:hypothetical protein
MVFFFLLKFWVVAKVVIIGQIYQFNQIWLFKYENKKSFIYILATYLKYLKFVFSILFLILIVWPKLF